MWRNNVVTLVWAIKKFKKAKFNEMICDYKILMLTSHHPQHHPWCQQFAAGLLWWFVKIKLTLSPQRKNKHQFQDAWKHVNVRLNLKVKDLICCMVGESSLWCVTLEVFHTWWSRIYRVASRCAVLMLLSIQAFYSLQTFKDNDICNLCPDMVWSIASTA